EVPMFFRTKSSGPRTYLQVVENRWEGGRSRQRVVATLGRLDQLRDSGQLDALLISGARLAHSVMILSAHAQGRLPVIRTQRIGPALIFERLWQQTGCQRVIQRLLADRRFEFDVERAIFLTVLHRLFVSGSDRAADKWRRYYRIEGCDSLQLHHLYRAMAWLGQELPKDQQKDATPFAPRCTKDRIEEALFEHRRDLFSELQLVFFDTTSIYFEGQGGESLGQRGYSKDHRPDLRQMIVGAVLDGQGRPICCELWPGNTTGGGGSTSWGPGCGPRARSGTRCSPGPVGIGSCIPSAMRVTRLHPWMSRRSTSRAGGTSSAATRTRPARTRPIERRSWPRCGNSYGRGTSR